MAIKVACRCGRIFTAKREHAGKQAKCPACGQVLAIPGIPLPAYNVFVSHSHADKPMAEAYALSWKVNRLAAGSAARYYARQGMGRSDHRRNQPVPGNDPRVFVRVQQVCSGKP